MANFGPKPWKNINFSTFSTSTFYSFYLLKAFFGSKISQNTLSWPRLPKKQDKKLANLGPKPWTNPFGKISIFRLCHLVFIAQKGVFSLQNIIKHIFLTQTAKKTHGKMAIFRPKPWDNPFGKMSNFRLFELLVFIAQKGVFSFQNIVKDIFLFYIA